MSVDAEFEKAGTEPSASAPVGQNHKIEAVSSALESEVVRDIADTRLSLASDELAKVEHPTDVELSEKLSIDAEDLADRVFTFLGRFIAYPSRAAHVVHMLWVFHAHLIEAWQSTPRLAFLSPEPGSGKSRAMEITGLLVPRALLTVNSSPAFLLRAIGDPNGRPTFLCDEIDTIFGEKGRGNEDLRGMINAGYRRGPGTGKCTGSNGQYAPELFETYAAMALAGLGDLPDTVMTRSVIIRLRKKAPDEHVEPYRQRFHEAEGHALRDEIATWSEGVFEAAANLIPALPVGIEDRNADVFEPIIASGDLVGGPWPQRARGAALQLIKAAKSTSRPTLGVQLLADIRTCFGDENQLPTARLIGGLVAMDEAPWGDIKGKKLDARQLSKLLKEYDIRSVGLRLSDGSTPKGYKRTSFHDAWKRYLPPAATSATSATDAT